MSEKANAEFFQQVMVKIKEDQPTIDQLQQAIDVLMAKAVAEFGQNYKTRVLIVGTRAYIGVPFSVNIDHFSMALVAEKTEIVRGD